MARVMIDCPATGNPVLRGLYLSVKAFERLPGVIHGSVRLTHLAINPRTIPHTEPTLAPNRAPTTDEPVREATKAP